MCAAPQHSQSEDVRHAVGSVRDVVRRHWHRDALPPHIIHLVCKFSATAGGDIYNYLHAKVCSCYLTSTRM